MAASLMAQAGLAPIAMIRVPGGVFGMGSPLQEADRAINEIYHSVRLDAFLMSASPITQGQFQSIMHYNNSHFLDENRPVEQVNWFEAVEFCNRLSQSESLGAVYEIEGEEVRWLPGRNGYRLPTEAEWEMAARAGTMSAYYTGQSINAYQANYRSAWLDVSSGTWKLRDQTSESGTFPANPWGFFDMAGNVWQWCWDWYGNYELPRDGGILSNPRGPKPGITKAIRGGSWECEKTLLRSACRGGIPRGIRNHCLGFRVARTSF